MLTFIDFFTNYPNTPYKSAKYRNAEDEFNNINPSQEEIKLMISHSKLEQDLRHFAQDNNRVYSQTPDPHFYLLQRMYTHKLPTKEEILRLPFYKSEIEITKESIMNSDIPKHEKVCLRFILSLSIKLGAGFLRYNKGCIYKNKGTVRVSEEWLEVLNKYDKNDMASSIGELTQFRDTGLYQKTVDLPLIQFTLKKHREILITPRCESSNTPSPVDVELEKIRETYKNFDDVIKSEKTGIGKMKAYFSMANKTLPVESINKCMGIISAIERKRNNIAKE